jgi:ATP phosphoribosyltransferase
MQAARKAIPQDAIEPAQRPLRVVLPKKGRLCAAFNEALARGGIALEKENARHDFGTLRADGQRMPETEALTMRAGDALRALAAGAADIAVVGLDALREFNAGAGAVAVESIVPLGLAPCALYIAAPQNAAITGAADLAGLRIATSLPGILRAFLDDAGVDGVTIVECEGGVEDTVRLGLADAVCDLVETGTTLAANGLAPVLKVMDSEAVLVTAAAPRSAADRAALAAVAHTLVRAARLRQPAFA